QAGSYTFSFDASGDPGGQVRGVVGLAVEPFTAYFVLSSPLTPTTVEFGQSFLATETTTQGQVAFQVGGSADPWTFCVDNVSLLGAPGEGYQPDTGPRVRVNQVAYLPKGPKNATLVTDATE